MFKTTGTGCRRNILSLVLTAWAENTAIYQTPGWLLRFFVRKTQQQSDPGIAPETFWSAIAYANHWTNEEVKEKKESI